MGNKSIQFLKADIYRYKQSTSWKQIIVTAIVQRTFRPILTLRLCQYFSAKNTIIYRPLLVLFILLHKTACHRACIDLNWKTTIGPGFCITHGWGTVISPEAVIGSNVTIFHGATIGTKHRILDDGERVASYPIIEDNVWIGANSVIIGGITVGTGSIIAPLSMVVKNVDPHSAIGCNPQKVIKETVVEDVFNKAPLEYIMKHSDKQI